MSDKEKLFIKSMQGIKKVRRLKSVHIGSDYEGKILTIRVEPGYNMKTVTGYIHSVYWEIQAILLLYS